MNNVISTATASVTPPPVVGGEVLLPPEENAIYQLGDQFSKWLGTGLADNWSQVGMQCLCIGAFLVVCTCMCVSSSCELQFLLCLVHYFGPRVATGVFRQVTNPLELRLS